MDIFGRASRHGAGRAFVHLGCKRDERSSAGAGNVGVCGTSERVCAAGFDDASSLARRKGNIVSEESVSKIMDLPHIISDPRVMHGKPVIEGTRLTVELILEKLSEGRSEEELLSAYPRLTREGLQAVLVNNGI